jgi:hypothetical protein
MHSALLPYPFLSVYLFLLLAPSIPDAVSVSQTFFDCTHTASLLPLLFFRSISLFCLFFLFLIQCRFRFRRNDGFVAGFLLLNTHGFIGPFLSFYLSIFLFSTCPFFSHRYYCNFLSRRICLLRIIFQDIRSSFTYF